MQKILLLFYISIILSVLLGGIWTPILMYYKGQLFKPNIIAIFSMLASVFGIFQFLMNKVSIKTSLIVTPILGLIVNILRIYVLYTYNIKVLIIVSMLTGPIVGLFFNHYSGVIQEIIKNKIEIQKLFNNMITVSSIAGIFGYGIGSLLTTTFNYIVLIKATIIFSVGIDILEFYISKVVYDFHLTNNT